VIRILLRLLIVLCLVLAARASLWACVDAPLWPVIAWALAGVGLALLLDRLKVLAGERA
jgi:hypothetical protein